MRVWEVNRALTLGTVRGHMQRRCVLVSSRVLFSAHIRHEAYMTRYSTFAFLVLLLVGCQRNEQAEHSSVSTSATSSESSTARVDTTAAEEPLPHFDGWIVGRDENVPNSGSRFSGHADRYRSGALVIYLDTSLKRAYPGEPPHQRAHADSLVVTGLAVGETFAQFCKVGSTLASGHTAGLMRDTVTERWLQPRLAWFFDTVSVRIRAIPTDSVSCMLEMPD